MFNMEKRYRNKIIIIIIIIIIMISMILVVLYDILHYCKETYRHK